MNPILSISKALPLIFMLLGSLHICTSMATFTRYTKPIPNDLIVIETNAQLRDVAKTYPDSALSADDNGYFMVDQTTGRKFAVVADSLIPELDRRVEEVEALIASGELERAPEDPEELQKWIAADPGNHFCTREEANCANSNEHEGGAEQGEQQKKEPLKDQHAGYDHSPMRCSHPRCFTSPHCLAYNDCHVCLTGHRWCI